MVDDMLNDTIISDCQSSYDSYSFVIQTSEGLLACDCEHKQKLRLNGIPYPLRRIQDGKTLKSLMMLRKFKPVVKGEGCRGTRCLLYRSSGPASVTLCSSLD